MIRQIVMHPDPRLREVCAPVGEVTADVRVLAEDMLETMYDAPGRGLAAPQVGVLSRLFVVDAGWKEGVPSPLVMIDPVVEAASNETSEMEEGCLSIPDTPVVVRRPETVTMSWTELAGGRVTRRLEGIEARCALHEMDHLDGVLIVDREAR